MNARVESVEEFLARGGEVQRDLPPPRQEKCSVPFGGVEQPQMRQFYAVTDGTRWSGGRKKMRDKGWKA